jgi:hypothetical protein
MLLSTIMAEAEVNVKGKNEAFLTGAMLFPLSKRRLCGHLDKVNLAHVICASL